MKTVIINKYETNMRKLKIKISGLTTMTKPQIEFGPYEYDDLIAKAIVGILTPQYLKELIAQDRIGIINKTADSIEYEYTYN